MKDKPSPLYIPGQLTNNALLDVENLASRFHQVYEEELKRQGKKSKHSYFFHELPKDIADIDRALARYVIDFVIPAVLKNYEKVKQSDNHLLDKITNRNEWQELLDKL